MFCARPACLLIAGPHLPALPTRFRTPTRITPSGPFAWHVADARRFVYRTATTPPPATGSALLLYYDICTFHHTSSSNRLVYAHATVPVAHFHFILFWQVLVYRFPGTPLRTALRTAPILARGCGCCLPPLAPASLKALNTTILPRLPRRYKTLSPYIPFAGYTLLRYYTVRTFCAGSTL